MSDPPREVDKDSDIDTECLWGITCSCMPSASALDSFLTLEGMIPSNTKIRDQNALATESVDENENQGEGVTDDGDHTEDDEDQIVEDTSESNRHELGKKHEQATVEEGDDDEEGGLDDTFTPNRSDENQERQAVKELEEGHISDDILTSSQSDEEEEQQQQSLESDASTTVENERADKPWGGAEADVNANPIDLTHHHQAPPKLTKDEFQRWMNYEPHYLQPIMLPKLSSSLINPNNVDGPVNVDIEADDGGASSTFQVTLRSLGTTIDLAGGCKTPSSTGTPPPPPESLPESITPKESNNVDVISSTTLCITPVVEPPALVAVVDVEPESAPKDPPAPVAAAEPESAPNDPPAHLDAAEPEPVPKDPPAPLAAAEPEPVPKDPLVVVAEPEPAPEDSPVAVAKAEPAPKDPPAPVALVVTKAAPAPVAKPAAKAQSTTKVPPVAKPSKQTNGTGGAPKATTGGNSPTKTASSGAVKKPSPTTTTPVKAGVVAAAAAAGGSPARPGSRRASTPQTPTTPEDAAKKVPMNKIKVGTAPAPNIKEVKSKIGSLTSTSGTGSSGGTTVPPNQKPLSSSTVKIPEQKLKWEAKSKVSSFNTSYVRQGGNVKVKVEPAKKVEVKAVASKVGSWNASYKPGGGEKKIFDDKQYLKKTQSNSSGSEHGGVSGPTTPRPPSSAATNGTEQPADPDSTGPVAEQKLIDA